MDGRVYTAGEMDRMMMPLHSKFRCQSGRHPGNVLNCFSEGDAGERCGQSFLFLPGAPFVTLAQTYCKNRVCHQNKVNVLLRAFFPKPGWSVLQDDRSLNFRKERAEFEVQNERKYPQNNARRPLNERKDLVERFSGCELFFARSSRNR